MPFINPCIYIYIPEHSIDTTSSFITTKKVIGLGKCGQCATDGRSYYLVFTPDFISIELLINIWREIIAAKVPCISKLQTVAIIGLKIRITHRYIIILSYFIIWIHVINSGTVNSTII